MVGLNKEHVALIAKNQAKFGIRGGTGLIFALFTILAGLIIGAALVDPASELQNAGASDVEVAQFADEIVTEVGRPVVKWATDASEDQLDFWLVENPALISAFLILFAIFVPFLSGLGSFNQLSGDIGSRGIRYLLLRTERINLFMGRFIGTYLFCLVVYAVLFAIMGLFFIFKLDFYGTGDMLLWLLRGFLVVSLYTLPFVAICSWVSCAIDSPFGSLSLCYLLIGGVPLIVWIAGRMNEYAGYLKYITPNAYKQWLFDPNIGKALGGGAIMLAFTAFFLFIGTRHFEGRDL